MDNIVTLVEVLKNTKPQGANAARWGELCGKLEPLLRDIVYGDGLKTKPQARDAFADHTRGVLPGDRAREALQR